MLASDWLREEMWAIEVGRCNKNRSGVPAFPAFSHKLEQRGEHYSKNLALEGNSVTKDSPDAGGTGKKATTKDI